MATIAQTANSTVDPHHPAVRIRAVAADGGITLDKTRIRDLAEKVAEESEWVVIGALTESIATLVEATANGDPTLARIALQVGAERVIAWYEGRAALQRMTCDRSQP